MPGAHWIIITITAALAIACARTQADDDRVPIEAGHFEPVQTDYPEVHDDPFPTLEPDDDAANKDEPAAPARPPATTRPRAGGSPP